MEVTIHLMSVAAMEWGHESWSRFVLVSCRSLFILLSLKNKKISYFQEEATMTDLNPRNKQTAPVWDRSNFARLTFKMIDSSVIVCASLPKKLSMLKKMRGFDNRWEAGALVAFPDNEGFVYVNIKRHTHIRLFHQLPPLLLFWSTPRISPEPELTCAQLPWVLCEWWEAQLVWSEMRCVAQVSLRLTHFLLPGLLLWTACCW